MQIYQKNGVTGRLCKSFFVASRLLNTRSIFCASVHTCGIHRNVLLYKIFFAIAGYPTLSPSTFIFYNPIFTMKNYYI